MSTIQILDTLRKAKEKEEEHHLINTFVNELKDFNNELKELKSISNDKLIDINNRIDNIRL